MELDKMVEQAYTITKEHGFFPDVPFSELTPEQRDKLLLEQLGCMHEETTEAFQEVRSGAHPNLIYYKLTEFGSKPEGFPTELADQAIRIMSLCGYMGIPLQDVILEKMEYNKKRPHLHGRKF